MNFREHFLQNCWLRYPAAPAGAPVTDQRRPERDWQIRRQPRCSASETPKQLVWHPQGLLPAHLEQAPPPSPEQVLTEGDWIAIREGGSGPSQVILLAPQLAPALELGVTAKTLRQLQEYRQAVRSFFVAHDFLEVATPTLVPSPGLEPHIEPFVSQLRFGDKTKTIYLPFSPEFHLKKLLSVGHGKIFELKTCFRNGEISPLHQPEFEMLEWYEIGADLNQIAALLEALVREVAEQMQRPRPQPFRRCSMSELFYEFLSFELRPDTPLKELASLAQARDLDLRSDDSWDDVFFRLFINFIEPKLGHTEPLIVRDYPPSQAALARLTPQGWADRFELYWRGIEIANAFHELNDPVEQRRRFAADLAHRRTLGASPVPIDEEFLQALDSGIPPSAGIALGLERLFMCVMKSEGRPITQLRAFSIKMD